MSVEKIVGATVGTPINPDKIVPPDATVYIGYTVDGTEMYEAAPENVQHIGFAVSAKGRPTDMGAYTWIPYPNNDDVSITVDDVLSDTSINPVQNKVITELFDATVSEFENVVSRLENVDTAIEELQPDEALSPSSRKPIQNQAVTEVVNILVNSLAAHGEDIEGIKDALENLPSGGGTVRTELVIDTPVWDNQPTASVADLKTVFHGWKSGNYFVTLKGTDGTALPSGQFKLTEALNGHTTAVDCVFTLEGNALTENYPVDFKEVDGVFKMRDAGVVGFTISTKNPLFQKYNLIYNGKAIPALNSDTRYVSLSDNYMASHGAKIKVFVWVGTYNGYNGILNATLNCLDGGCKKVGFKISAERTQNGMVGKWNFLANVNSSRFSDPWFTDTTEATDDYTKVEIADIRITSNNRIYYANGSHIILEETA